jgi:hypothetical protein
MWLEDFELVGSASVAVTAQAGSFQRKRDAPTTEVQAIPGNMSNVLSAGANLSLWLGRRIPTISSVTGVAAWAMRHTANIAASYGWAKPIVATVPQKVIATNIVYQHNVDVLILHFLWVPPLTILFLLMLGLLALIWTRCLLPT